MTVFSCATLAMKPLSPKLVLASLIIGMGWWLGCAPHQHYRTDLRETLQAANTSKTASIVTNLNYALAVIEFDDQGEFWDRRQLNGALRLIEQRGANDPRPIMLMVYVHGWKHSAVSTNYESFHRFITNFAAVLPSIPEMTNFMVVGAYLSWRGGVLKDDSFLENLSIYNRWKTADRVGGPSCTEALFSLIGAVRGNDLRHTGANIPSFWQQSKVLVIGHSMGARVVDTALSQGMLASILENGPKEAAALKDIEAKRNCIETNNHAKASLENKITSLGNDFVDLQRREASAKQDLAALRNRHESDQRFTNEFQARIAKIENHEKTAAVETSLLRRAEIYFEDLVKERKNLEQLARTNGCNLDISSLPGPLAKPATVRKVEFERLEKHGNDLSTLAKTIGSNATLDNVRPGGSGEFFEALAKADSIIKALVPQIDKRIEIYHEEEEAITEAEKSFSQDSEGSPSPDFHSQRQRLLERYARQNASFQTRLETQASSISAAIQELNAVSLLSSPALAELAAIPPPENTANSSKPGLLMNKKYAGRLIEQITQARVLLAAKQEPLARDIKASAKHISARLDSIIDSTKADCAASEAISEDAELARRETPYLKAQRDHEQSLYESANQRIALFSAEHTRLAASFEAARASLKKNRDDAAECERSSHECDKRIDRLHIDINEIKRKLKPPPADLVMLLNPAFTAISAKKMISALKQERAQPFQPVAIEKARFGEKYVLRQWKAPLMICISSTNDWPTAKTLPFAKNLSSFLSLNFRKTQYREQADELYQIDLAQRVQTGNLKLPATFVPLPSQRDFATRTAPHIESLLSHDIVLSSVPFSECCESNVIRANLYQRPHAGTNETYKLYTPGKSWEIAPRENAWNQSPYWVMQAPDNLIIDHSEFWTTEFSGLLAGLFRIAHDLQKQSPRHQSDTNAPATNSPALTSAAPSPGDPLTPPAAQESAGSP